jgi:hypothetical protein
MRSLRNIPEKVNRWTAARAGVVACLTSRVFITGSDSCYKCGMAQKRPAKIDRAQTLKHYRIGGELFARIKYGDECFGWRVATTPCHDCAVTEGQFHVPGCDVEECPNCHTQLLSCECDVWDVGSPG